MTCRKDISKALSERETLSALGMLYSIYKGYDPQISLRIASCAGAACLSEENSIDGIMPLGGIMKLESEYNRKVI